MLIFSLVGTIADVDSTTPDNPPHPSPVLLLETDEDGITRVVMPETASPVPIEALQVGRRVLISAEAQLFPAPGSLPVAFHFEFVDVH